MLAIAQGERWTLLRGAELARLNPVARAEGFAILIVRKQDHMRPITFPIRRHALAEL